MSRLAVIGRGMIGSAAARHLAKAGHDVALIGPGEPQARGGHDGVFASHYDEGRITRLLDPHPVWAGLSAASMARYGEIAAESGITFYQETGVLTGAPEGSEYLDRLRKVRDGRGIDCRELSGDELRAAFPCLVFDSEIVMLHAPGQAGHLSPRRMVAAQTRAAVRAGAVVIDDWVRGIEGGQVTTGAEKTEFDRILVAAGCYANTILSRALDLKLLGRTITFLELDETEVARLREMPPVIYRVSDCSDPYLLPPIRYPDGRWYLKIGGEPEELVLEPHDLGDWFRSDGNADVGRYHLQRLRGLLPGIRFRGVHRDSCVVTMTATGLPYIGAMTDRVVVAVGGCGGAAKSCDEIGRIAAEAVLGKEDARFATRAQEKVA